MNEFYDVEKLFNDGVGKTTEALEKLPSLVIELRKKYSVLLPKLKALRDGVEKLEKKKGQLEEDCKNVRLETGKLRQEQITLKSELDSAKTRHDEAIRVSKEAFKRESSITRHSLDKRGLELTNKEKKLGDDKEEVKKRLLTVKGMQEKARDKVKEMEQRTGELQKKEVDLSGKKMKFEKERLEFEQNQLGQSDAIDKAVEMAIAKREIDLQQREAVVTFKEKAFSKKKTELDKRERALKIEEIRLKDKVRTFEANR